MKRTTLYKLLPIAARELGWDDDTYRPFLQKHGATEKDGKISASTMQVWQMENALKEQKQSGFVIKSNKQWTLGKAKSKDWRAPRIKLINDLWKQLQDSDHPDSVRSKEPEALKAWYQNAFPKLQDLRWANTYQLNSIIEQLKQWAKRCELIK